MALRTRAQRPLPYSLAAQLFKARTVDGRSKRQSDISDGLHERCAPSCDNRAAPFPLFSKGSVVKPELCAQGASPSWPRGGLGDQSPLLANVSETPASPRIQCRGRVEEIVMMSVMAKSRPRCRRRQPGR